MKKLAIRMAALALVALGAGVACAVNFPCGTYVIAGSVRNSENALYTPDDFAEDSENTKIVIQAVSAKNGSVLAESQITDPYANASAGVNCYLRIPLSTTATEKTAAVGDSVNIVLKQGEDLSMASSPIAISRANAVTGLVMKIAAVYTYTNQNDKSQIVTVAKDYVDGLDWQLETPGTYDPFLDYDGDGSSNYAEYVNGTDPFNAEDYLKITDAKMTSGGNFLITFTYSGGHVYGVDATKALGSQASWSKKPLKTSEDGKAQLAVTYPGTEADVDYATIYLVPASKTNEFFRVEGR